MPFLKFAVALKDKQNHNLKHRPYTMFANIAIAFLISLGIALALLLGVKGFYARFSPEMLHILVAALAIAGSTAAGTVALSSHKALKYVASLESGAKNVTEQVDALQGEYGLDSYGISASGLLNGYVDGTAAAAKSKLKRARTLSIVVMAVLNLLLLLFLANAAGKVASSYSRSYDTDDDLDDLGSSSSSFDDLDLD